MDSPIRRPEQILAYRPLWQILGPKLKPLWSVGPGDAAQAAIQLMADKDIGFLVVLDRGAMVGVLSERDCVRRLLLTGKPAQTTPVSELMARDVVSVDTSHTFADCLRLMHRHRIRHLPVIENDGVLAVISIRDLLAEAVSHHAKIITELERERMTIFTSTA